MDTKKDEDEGRQNPFVGLERSSVLQEARTVFNRMPLRPRDCVHILTKLLFLLYQGESIGSTDATETFFAITKLFQNQDATLRRMVHLTIKEMAGLSENVIIVTSSLTKDMTGKVDAYRATAIRALCRITDSSSIQQIERYLKQAIVDRNPQVQSAALVSSLHLAKQNFDVVKRWNNEAQQALNSRSPMAQYHALGLLHHIKHRDRLAVSKLVTSQMNSSTLRSPYAACLLIRYATQVMQEDPEQDADRKLFDFLESCLRNRSEIVIYEAARAIVNMTNVTPRELSPAVSVLQLFLSSPKPTLRFAAVRTLNKIAMTHPSCLKTCNLDMENLINDSNRSIATLAITTLLKTGSEASIDRLMKQIASFMSEIPDEFKTVVVDAIRSLCLKFPKKHSTMLAFLSTILRDEGGFEYKKSIVDTIVNIVETVPESTETGLAQLCEFIEDCEFPSLLTRILFMLGEQGPRTPHPSKHIRFIYNRVILENEEVRAAAITALAKFGVQCESLRPSVVVLLRRCLSDPDDEVRDRAAFYLDLLEEQTPAVASKYTSNSLPVSLPGLERALLDYVQNPSDTPFDIKTVPIEVPKAVEAPTDAELLGGGGSASKGPSLRDQYAEQLAAVPEFAGLGPLFKSSDSVALTEAELEYIVKYVKHIFGDYCVFQFNLTNTVNDQQLEAINVVVEPVDTELDESSVISVPCPLLKYGQPASAYVAIPLDATNPSQTFTARLEYIVKDCDPETGEPDEEGYEDTYSLEDIEVTLADMMQAVNKPNFAAAWDQLADQFEMEETFGLESMGSLEEAVEKITGFLGMEPCERSAKVKADVSSHTLYLSGIYIGGHDVLARARLALDDGVTLHLAVRSSDEETCQLVGSSIG